MIYTVKIAFTADTGDENEPDFIEMVKDLEDDPEMTIQNLTITRENGEVAYEHPTQT